MFHSLHQTNKIKFFFAIDLFKSEFDIREKISTPNIVLILSVVNSL